MEGSSEFQDWEFLQNSDSEENTLSFLDIKSDYFILTSPKSYTKHEDQITEIEPLSDKLVVESQKGGSFPAEEVTLEGIDAWRHRKFEEVASVYEESEKIVVEIEKGDCFVVKDSNLEGNWKGVEEGRHPECEEVEKSKEIESVWKGSEKLIMEIEKEDSFLTKDSNMEIEKSEEIESLCKESEKLMLENEKGDSCIAQDAILEVNCEEIEVGHRFEKREESDKGEFVKMGEDEFNSLAVSGKNSMCEGEKKGLDWWKLPLEMIKLCAFRMRPIWSIPITVAVIGIVMMARRLYKMKPKSRRIPLKIAIDDKNATSQLAVRAARLNEAFARRVPVVRSPLLPYGGVNPWPFVALL